MINLEYLEKVAEYGYENFLEKNANALVRYLKKTMPEWKVTGRFTRRAANGENVLAFNYPTSIKNNDYAMRWAHGELAVAKTKDQKLKALKNIHKYVGGGDAGGYTGTNRWDLSKWNLNKNISNNSMDLGFTDKLKLQNQRKFTIRHFIHK